MISIILDRMFEMFKEARVNLVATHIPREKNTKEYEKDKELYRKMSC
ncbi:MAG: hypothetical protein U5K00_16235 [Melioribacteraceae bacterium]|nr:hypothetical protein [Melioribacteraceae bacterium]